MPAPRHRRRRRNPVLIAAAVLCGMGSGVTNAGTPAEVCGGIVFDDVIPDGKRAGVEAEPGLGDVLVAVADDAGSMTMIRTDATGRWTTGITPDRFPIRIVVHPPSDFSSTIAGPDHRGLTHLVSDASECGSELLVGLLDQTRTCTGTVEFVTACYTMGDAPHLGSAAAIVAVGADATDLGSVASTAGEPWIDGSYRVVATHDEVGTVWGQAVGPDGTIYATSFVKRHTRSRSERNPTGNPTVVFRVAPDGPIERLATVDPSATAPRSSIEDGNRDDLATMDLVYTSGLGDLEISPDGTHLYTIDLGRRLLVELDARTGATVRSLALDGRSLGIDDCAVAEDNPAGDLRPFGLGWADRSLLIGVVCSAASTVDARALPIVESPEPEDPAGDHDALIGYVFELADGGFLERLSWPLAGDRGNTFSSGLLSNDAAWHPWVPTYPFVAEHEFVSYPQPAITDLEVMADGSLVIALGDRWGHQTGPDTLAPRSDGSTASIAEPVIAGDLQRACPSGDGWMIEGRSGCAGGVGNNGEHFHGERYGWHDETALGAVAHDPWSSDVVITQMDPIVDDGAWRSGGLARHGEDGGYIDGVRLYDGRDADPDHTFEKATGLGDLEALCDGPVREIGGIVWSDTDRDGELDAAETGVADVVVELHRGDVVTATTTTEHDGWYTFRHAELAGAGRRESWTLVVPTSDENVDIFATGGALAETDLTRVRDDLDRTIATRAEPGESGARYDVRLTDASVDHAVHFGYRGRYQMAVTTHRSAIDPQHGDRVAIDVVIRNEGGVDSGAFLVEDRIPAGTVLIEAEPPPTESSGRTIRWAVSEAESIAPDEELSIRLWLRRVDGQSSTIVNEATVHDADEPATSDVGGTMQTTAIELSNIIGAVGDGRRSVEPGVHVALVDSNLVPVAHTHTDDRGGFAFRHVRPGSYRLAFDRAADPELLAGVNAARIVRGGSTHEHRFDPDMTPHTGEIEIGAGQPTVVDVVLTNERTVTFWRRLLQPIPLLALASVATCLGLLAKRYRRGRYSSPYAQPPASTA